VWGITIQNEPMATQTWESCVFQASDERDFLKNHLGPVMAQEGMTAGKSPHHRLGPITATLISPAGAGDLRGFGGAKLRLGRIGFHW